MLCLCLYVGVNPCFHCAVVCRNPAYMLCCWWCCCGGQTRKIGFGVHSIMVSVCGVSRPELFRPSLLAHYDEVSSTKDHHTRYLEQKVGECTRATIYVCMYACVCARMNACMTRVRIYMCMNECTELYVRMLLNCVCVVSLHICVMFVRVARIDLSVHADSRAHDASHQSRLLASCTWFLPAESDRVRASAAHYRVGHGV